MMWKKGTAMSWTDERIETLRKLWAEGHSASQIADTLGGGVSRNAVIGKIHRLGLSGRVKSTRTAQRRPAVRAKPAPKPAAPPPAAQPRVMAVGSTVVKVVARETPEPEAAPVLEAAPEPRIAEVVPLHGGVSLFDLKASSCRWPVGDPSGDDFSFCGLKTNQGETYCTAHAEAAFPARQKPKKKD
ncbi:MAG: GcrA family cell cycle regulator [Pseudomonadota bacterium]